MKGLPMHWLSTGRWQQVAAVAPVALTVFFFLSIVKGAPPPPPCHGLVSWEPVLGLHLYSQEACRARERRDGTSGMGGPLLIPWQEPWEP